MARQAKDRKVCGLPKNVQFQPGFEEELDDAVIMTVEEYEAIRLIDYMGFTQEECANHMHVARTTVQRIYNEARRKLSVFLVDGYKLYISGGSYEVCEKSGNCGCQSNPCKEGGCKHKQQPAPSSSAERER